MLDALKYYVDTRLKYSIDKDEIYNALDFHRWKSRDEILKVINEKRVERDQIQFEDEKHPALTTIIQGVKSKMTYLLLVLEREDLVEAKSELELTENEASWSTEADLKDSVKQAARIRSRGGKERYVYRRTQGKKLEEPKQITEAEKAY